jgi:hypothetical protein
MGAAMATALEQSRDPGLRKEYEFCFYHRRDSLYRLLLNEFKNNPLNQS